MKTRGSGNYYYGARYYNPKWSIWLSVDPLAEEFPAWSPYNYTLQNPVRYVDPDGRAPQDFTILIAKDGAGGRGHMGAIIQDGNGNYYYVTMWAAENAGVSKMASSGVNGGMNVQELKGARTMKDAIKMAKQDTGNSPYTDALTFETNSKQDQIIYEKTLQKAKNVNSGNDKYNVLTNNCTDGCERPIEDALQISLPENPEPNSNFENLKDDKTNIQKEINSKNINPKSVNIKDQRGMNEKVRDNTKI